MSDTIYYKILKEYLIHKGFQYKLGLYIDTKEFNPSCSYESGGLYFTDKDNIGTYLKYGIYIAEITIPDDAKVYKDPLNNVWKADKIFINKYCSFEEWNGWNEKSYILALDNNCNSIWIPEEYKIKKLCLLAIEQNYYALQHVPEKFITKELCELVIKKDNQALDDRISKQELDYTIENFKIKEFYLRIIKNHYYAIQWIPEKYKIKELYETSIKCNGYTLRYVPEEFKTKELCLIAVNQNGLVLEFVPEKFITVELYLLAVKNNGYVLEFVIEELKTKNYV